MTSEEIQRVDKVVSTLNNLMEKHSGFFSGEFGCEEDEIVDYYGFGYSPDDKKIRIQYLEVDSICNSKYAIEQVEQMIVDSNGDPEKEIRMILKIQQEN